jgi:hypothetical protein
LTINYKLLKILWPWIGADSLYLRPRLPWLREKNENMDNDKNNNKKIASLAAALVALVAVSGIAFSSFAQDDSAANDTNNCFGPKRMGAWQNLSDDEKAALEAGREARQEAVRAALEAGDYQAWQEAVGENSPFYGKITTEEDFAKLTKAHSYLEKGRALMEELGVEKGFGPGMGMFGGYGRRGGMGK